MHALGVTSLLALQSLDLDVFSAMSELFYMNNVDDFHLDHVFQWLQTINGSFHLFGEVFERKQKGNLVNI